MLSELTGDTHLAENMLSQEEATRQLRENVYSVIIMGSKAKTLRTSNMSLSEILGI